MQEKYQEFQEIGINWVAITSDKMENLRKMADRCRFSFPLLSDPEGRVARNYGVIWDGERGHNDPGVFVVRFDGPLTYQGIISGPRGRPPVGDVLTVVRKDRQASEQKKGAAASSAGTVS